VTPLHLDLTAVREKQRLERQLETSLTRLAHEMRNGGELLLKKRKSRSGRFRRSE
jgi:hypothetical protein